MQSVDEVSNLPILVNSYVMDDKIHFCSDAARHIFSCLEDGRIFLRAFPVRRKPEEQQYPVRCYKLGSDWLADAKHVLVPSIASDYAAIVGIFLN